MVGPAVATRQLMKALGPPTRDGTQDKIAGRSCTPAHLTKQNTDGVAARPAESFEDASMTESGVMWYSRVTGASPRAAPVPSRRLSFNESLLLPAVLELTCKSVMDSPMTPEGAFPAR